MSGSTAEQLPTGAGSGGLPPVPQTPEALAAALEAAGRTAGRPLAAWLVERGLLTRAALEQAVADRRPGERLGETLVRLGALAPEQLDRARAAALAVPFVEPERFAVEPAAVAALPQARARALGVLPLCFVGPALLVACPDPADAELQSRLGFETDQVVQLVLARADELERAVARHYAAAEDRAALDELRARGVTGDGTRGRDDPEALARREPVVRLVQHLLVDAVRRRASDVHLRPLEDELEVLFRVDGQLLSERRMAKALLPALVSRLKTLGDMNVAEHRLPQDGRARTEVDGREVDLRLSVIPMVQGESVVVRILDAAVGLKRLDDLGFEAADRTRFAELLGRSAGLILVTGPTGCGKSTTLYAALQELRPRPLHLVTLENPVEYRMPGVDQIQVNPVTGLTFARALRHILRHDPDVVMVGEIRDAETAKIAVEASLTGHLVLSTLHTNDAATAVTRLLEIGLPPYLVGASLLAVLAQRLVRRNCRHCVAPEPADATVASALGVAPEEGFRRGTGCRHCHGTGYAGRQAVYELLVAGPELRARIAAGADATELARLAEADGMIPLTCNALSLARRGVTSLAEVLRVRTG